MPKDLDILCRMVAFSALETESPFFGRMPKNRGCYLPDGDLGYRDAVRIAVAVSQGNTYYGEPDAWKFSHYVY